MSVITPVFQYEIRFNHILDFAQLGKKVLAPFVKLSKGIKVENHNMVDERITLEFEDNYAIVVTWDRILIRAQGNIDRFHNANSPIEMPFFSIVEKLKDLEDFGSIQNALLAINYIKYLGTDSQDLTKLFMDKAVKETTTSILENTTDIAITI
jgi:hypothetical protein